MKMTKEQFTEIIGNYMNALGAINALYAIGIDFTHENNTFPLESFIDHMYETAFDVLLSEEKKDILNFELFGKQLEEDEELDMDKLYESVFSN
jgi:hypothetical protein